MLDSGLLQTLLLVAEEKNYTRAGERSGLTQQAVSAQIKRLETSLGRRIIDRTGHGVAMTSDGEALIAYAKQLVEIDERVRRQFSAIPLVGSVRVGVLEGFATIGLPGVLAAVRSIQPNLEIIVETASTDSLIARMDQGRLDIVLGLQRENGSRGEALRKDEVFWFGDPSPYSDPNVPVRLVTYPEPSLPRTVAVEALTAAGRPFAVTFESNSLTSLRAAAIAGLGVAPFCSLFNGGEAAAADQLPSLGTVELFLRVAQQGSEAVATFAGFMRTSAVEAFRSTPGFL